MSSPTCTADLDEDDICDNVDPCVGDIGNIDYDGDGILFACDPDFGNTGPACSASGQVCVVHAQCCSMFCLDNGLGLSTCQPLDGCQPLKEICAQGSDCCSGSCVPVGTSGVGLCLDPQVAWTMVKFADMQQAIIVAVGMTLAMPFLH